MDHSMHHKAQQKSENKHSKKDSGHTNHASHSNHHQMMALDFRKRFIVSGLITIPILALSPTVQGWLGYSLPDIPALKWLLFILASIVAVWGAKPFYTNALGELRKKQLGMMVLVSLAVGSGYLYSAATTFLIDAPDFYWEISTLAVFLLFGHWMEMRSVVGASGALKELVKLIPPKANLLRDGSIEEVETKALQIGDVILVRPGEKIPIDGVVIEGSSNVNESMLTGESKPVAKKEDQLVIGGSLNIDGSLKVRVTKIGKDTALAQIIALVSEAQNSKPKTQRLADRAAHYLTLTAIIVGILTLILWSGPLGGTFVFALTLAITVVVITCPHALGLAIPMVTTVTTSLAAKNGMLIRDMDGLDMARQVDVVLFDKTGTLTKGEFGVSDVIALGDLSKDDVLRVGASIDQHSEHVIAKSIVKAAKENGSSLVDPKDFSYAAGQGVSGVVDGKKMFFGNKSLMQAQGIETKKVRIEATNLSSQGKTVIYLASEKEILGLVALSDVLKEESFSAIKQLQSLGLQVVMLTGDNTQTAQYVAGQLGLHTFFADVLPDQKIAKVKELQKGGKKVMMVGDGVNDAPALTQADVGIAIGAGTDVAVASSEIVLVKNNPLDIVKLIRLSKETRKKMVQNLLWATGYNLVAIPIAAGVLVPVGFVLRPEWGALAMSLSSIIVVANALLLRRIHLTK